MKKINVLLILFTSLVSIGQGNMSLNYFYNLGYFNPAYIDDNTSLLDFSSLSLYNSLPLGVYGYSLYGQLKTDKSIGGSLAINSSVVGKSLVNSQYDISFNYYTDVNLRYKLSFGLGAKLYTNSVDESKLLTDVDLGNYSYSYGEEYYRETYYQFPVGIAIYDSKLKLGGYFSKGVGVGNSYGLYSDLLLFEAQVNNYGLKDFIGLAFHKEFLNAKVSFENEIRIDNYKVNLFYNYNFSEASFSNQSIGVGLFYNWRLFDVNYQLAINNNNLGLSHQLGLQVFVK